VYTCILRPGFSENERFHCIMIMVIIEIQGRARALLLLVKPLLMLHQNNDTAQTSYINYLLIKDASLCQCSTCYTAVRINNCLKIFCNHSSHYENYGQFSSTKLTLFMLNKDTKKGIGKSEECIACTAVWQKACISQAEAAKKSSL